VRRQGCRHPDSVKVRHAYVRENEIRHLPGNLLDGHETITRFVNRVARIPQRIDHGALDTAIVIDYEDRREHRSPPTSPARDLILGRPRMGGRLAHYVPGRHATPPPRTRELCG
jgi:hypothetical protein